MSKKTYELIVTISGAVSAIAIGLVTYFKPEGATAINSSIEIAESAVTKVASSYLYFVRVLLKPPERDRIAKTSQLTLQTNLKRSKKHPP